MPDCEAVCGYFTLKELGFQFHPQVCFISPLWKFLPTWLFVLWRIATCVLLTGIIVLEILQTGMKYDSIVYWFALPINSIMVVFIFTYVLWLSITFAYVCLRQNVDKTTKVMGYRILWFLLNFSWNAILMMAVVFWILEINPSDMYRHITFEAMLIVDLIVSAVPIRLLHCVYPIITFFLLFTLLYLLNHFLNNGVTLLIQNHTTYYPQIQWNRVSAVLTSLIFTILLIIFIQCGLYMLHVFKNLFVFLIHENVVHNDSEKSVDENEEDYDTSISAVTSSKPDGDDETNLKHEKPSPGDSQGKHFNSNNNNINEMTPITIDASKKYG